MYKRVYKFKEWCPFLNSYTRSHLRSSLYTFLSMAYSGLHSCIRFRYTPAGVYKTTLYTCITFSSSCTTFSYTHRYTRFTLLYTFWFFLYTTKTGNRCSNPFLTLIACGALVCVINPFFKISPEAFNPVFLVFCQVI